MKKLIAIAAIAAFNYANAQTNDFNYAVNSQKLKENTLVHFGNAKVLKNFAKDFKDATMPEWFEEKNNEAMCRFYQKGILTMAYYKSNGSPIAYVKHYEENELSKKIATLVKDSYRGYKIIFIDEINMMGKETVYVVHVQSEKNLKLLRVQEDDIEVIKDFTE